MSINAKLMTADELLHLPDDGMRHELIRGVLHTMPPAGSDHCEQTSIFDGSLGPYVRRNKLGRVLAGEPGFVLATDPDTVRAPDVAFLTRENAPKGRLPGGYLRGIPDLAVEVISPNDRYTRVAQKVAEWLEYGTRLVFVVDPRRETVAVHRPGQPVVTLGRDDTLTAEELVPGWSLPVRELFDVG